MIKSIRFLLILLMIGLNSLSQVSPMTIFNKTIIVDSIQSNFNNTIFYLHSNKDFEDLLSLIYDSVGEYIYFDENPDFCCQDYNYLFGIYWKSGLYLAQYADGDENKKIFIFLIFQ